ncbi:hypothetical protein HRbin35_00164 [bacterium HR35]|nr:hypothetical protein HRbin35_00164 [bacterium HR35]
MKKALTLIELTFFMLIISFILFVFLLFIINISNANIYLVFGLGSYSDVNLALSQLKKELKSAEDSNVGHYPLELVSSTSIIFYSDVNNDGLVERVRYFLDGEELKRGIVFPNGNPLNYNLNQEKIQVLVKNLIPNQKIFSFYDENLNETLDIAKIKVIKVNLKVKIDTKGNTWEDYIFISPRNLITK